MCKRLSLILTRSGKVHDGYGVTHHHTVIRELAGFHANDDMVNAYEWQPPKGWPDADWNLGLVKDTIVFETKSSHESALERFIRNLYPTMESWDAGDKPRSMAHIENFTGTLDLRHLTSAKDLVLPTTLGGGLDLRHLTSAEGLVLPTTLGGWLDLSHLTSAEGLVLPTSIGGGLYLSGLTSAEGLVLPTTLGGWLDLNHLTSAKDLVLPTSIGGGLYLRGLTSAEGLVLPTSIGGGLDLSSKVRRELGM